MGLRCKRPMTGWKHERRHSRLLTAIPVDQVRGDIEYNGHDHFTVNLKGSSDYYGFSDNQKVAHEFEHGRQVLDGELSFKQAGDTWVPFAHDLTDEAKGFEAGFRSSQRNHIRGRYHLNGARKRTTTQEGIPGEAQYLGDHNYSRNRGLPMQLNVPNPPPPGVYEVPQIRSRFLAVLCLCGPLLSQVLGYAQSTEPRAEIGYVSLTTVQQSKVDGQADSFTPNLLLRFTPGNGWCGKNSSYDRSIRDRNTFRWNREHIVCRPMVSMETPWS